MPMKRMLTATVAAGLLCSACSSPPAPAPTQKEERPGKPWNGGKPRLPINIQGELQGRLQAGVEVPLRVVVTPQRPCAQLRTEVQGGEGLSVLEGAPLEHGPCVEDQPVVRQVLVRSESSGAGLALVTASMLVDGRWQSATSALSLAAEGAQATPRKPDASTTGALGEDSDGQPIILMPSSPP